MKDSPFNSEVDFSGEARLFPLPNLVMFPPARQGLHIFEPRYRQMTADALAGDRLIALVLLKDGWEADYDRQPAIHPVACLGKITHDQLLPDGRYNLLFDGLARVRILEELPKTKLYRNSRVELLRDCVDRTPTELGEIRRELADRVLVLLAAGPARRQFEELFHSDETLGVVCNLVSFALPLPLAVKQQLLEMDSVVERASHLIHHVQALSTVGSLGSSGKVSKPHPFSPN